MPVITQAPADMPVHELFLQLVENLQLLVRALLVLFQKLVLDYLPKLLMK